MRGRARSARLPRKLLRGQKLLDGISGEEIYQRAPTTYYQRGMYMHKKNYDYLTTEQMEEMLMTKIEGASGSYQGGQGNEVPNYSNLPEFANDAAAIAAGYVLGMPYRSPAGVMVNVGFNHVGQVTDEYGNYVTDEYGNPVYYS